jgi:hypothetical protein
MAARQAMKKSVQKITITSTAWLLTGTASGSNKGKHMK